MAEPELAQTPAFRAREWRFERFGWAAITVAFLVAAGGGWGYGPVSNAVETAGDARVEYTRVVHRETQDELLVRGEGTSVRLLGDWALAVDIERITPEPESMAADSSGLTLTFPDGGVYVWIDYRSEHAGPLTGAVEVGGHRLTLWQLVLP